MSLAVLVPGQGTQHADMLPWLIGSGSCAPLDALAELLGTDWRDRLADVEWATRNRVAQPLITALALGAWDRLQALLPAPAVVAGYSVGEVAAFAVAGVVSAADALTIATERARLMEAEADQQAPAGLMAVHGLSADALRDGMRACQLQRAITLGPDKHIVGGLLAHLDAAQRHWEAAGVTCTRLAVRLASHTAWMAGAVAPFQQGLAHYNFGVPQAVLVCNAEASVVRRPDALRNALAHQLAQTVHWDQCMDAVAERRPCCVLEVGPGTTLTRLWRERYPDIPARSIDEFHSVEAIAAWVRRTVAQS